MKTLGTLIDRIWNQDHTFTVMMILGVVTGGVVGYKASGGFGWTLGGAVIGLIVAFIVGVALEAAINGLDTSYDD